mmetsp:Transcript_8525/g.27185  ORF Transcript_8525/g.27185 Transcript_8525/m.27185 type:complete len:206 (-) Transcript_8525:307-924(-)
MLSLDPVVCARRMSEATVASPSPTLAGAPTAAPTCSSVSVSKSPSQASTSVPPVPTAGPSGTDATVGSAVTKRFKSWSPSARVTASFPCTLPKRMAPPAASTRCRSASCVGRWSVDRRRVPPAALPRTRSARASPTLATVSVRPPRGSTVTRAATAVAPVDGTPACCTSRSICRKAWAKAAPGDRHAAKAAATWVARVAAAWSAT